MTTQGAATPLIVAGGGGVQNGVASTCGTSGELLGYLCPVTWPAGCAGASGTGGTPAVPPCGATADYGSWYGPPPGSGGGGFNGTDGASFASGFTTSCSFGGGGAGASPNQGGGGVASSQGGGGGFSGGSSGFCFGGKWGGYSAATDRTKPYVYGTCYPSGGGGSYDSTNPGGGYAATIAGWAPYSPGGYNAAAGYVMLVDTPPTPSPNAPPTAPPSPPLPPPPASPSAPRSPWPPPPPVSSCTTTASVTTAGCTLASGEWSWLGIAATAPIVQTFSTCPDVRNVFAAAAQHANGTSLVPGPLMRGDITVTATLLVRWANSALLTIYGDGIVYSVSVGTTGDPHAAYMVAIASTYYTLQCGAGILPGVWTHVALQVGVSGVRLFIGGADAGCSRGVAVRPFSGECDDCERPRWGSAPNPAPAAGFF